MAALGARRAKALSPVERMPWQQAAVDVDEWVNENPWPFAFACTIATTAPGALGALLMEPCGAAFLVLGAVGGGTLGLILLWVALRVRHRWGAPRKIQRAYKEQLGKAELATKYAEREGREAVERAQEELGARIAELEKPKPRPNVVFLPPEKQEWVGLNDGRTGHFLLFVVANDPEDPELAETALDVFGLFSVYASDGTPLYRDVKARWQHTGQDQGPLDPTATPELLNATLPPNGQRYRLDSVMSLHGPHTPCYVWNNDSRKELFHRPNEWRIDEDEFIIEMTVRGTKVPPVTQRLRVTVFGSFFHEITDITEAS